MGPGVYAAANKNRVSYNIKGSREFQGLERCAKSGSPQGKHKRLVTSFYASQRSSFVQLFRDTDPTQLSLTPKPRRQASLQLKRGSLSKGLMKFETSPMEQTTSQMGTTGESKEMPRYKTMGGKSEERIHDPPKDLSPGEQSVPAGKSPAAAANSFALQSTVAPMDVQREMVGPLDEVIKETC